MNKRILQRIVATLVTLQCFYNRKTRAQTLSSTSSSLNNGTTHRKANVTSKSSEVSFLSYCMVAIAVRILFAWFKRWTLISVWNCFQDVESTLKKDWKLERFDYVVSLINDTFQLWRDVEAKLRMWNQPLTDVISRPICSDVRLTFVKRRENNALSTYYISLFSTKFQRYKFQNFNL